MALPVSVVAPSASGQPKPDAAAPMVRVWLEVLDAKGRVVTSVAPSELSVFENGVELGDFRLGGQAERIDTAIVVDEQLSSSGTLRRGSAALARRVERLVELGEVEILRFDEEQLTPTFAGRDSLVLREMLVRSGLAARGHDRIPEIRRRALAKLATGPERDEAQTFALLTAAIDEELELVSSRLRTLLAWASESPPTTSDPRVLIWVIGGFELGPAEFYSAHVSEPTVARQLLGHAGGVAGFAAKVNDNARALAALGWTVLPLAIPPAAGVDELELSSIESHDPQQGGSTAAPAVTVRPGSLFGRSRHEAGAELEVKLDARQALQLYADATAGDVVIAERALVDAVERLAGRVSLDYQPIRGDRQGDESRNSLREISLVASASAKLEIRTRRWRAVSIPPAVTRARIEALLEGEEPPDAAFEIAAIVRPSGAVRQGDSSGRLEARIDQFDPGAEIERVQLSIAWIEDDGLLHIESELLSPRVTREFELVREVPMVENPIVVLVEGLGGSWGGRKAAVSDVSDDDDGGSGSLLPTATVVEIRRPDEDVLRGKIEFEMDVFDDRVARVKYYLDDREVASSTAAEAFGARIELGRTPRRRTLRVVAFDAAERELGRDTAVLNSGSAGLSVVMVAPTNRNQTGSVEFEAEIAVPLERRLDRVLFFWNNTVVATLYSGPYRQRIEIPDDEAMGYVRVVAMLDDGTLAEDVLFMNGPRASERLDVSLVELYVVVTDRDGRPVRGLGQGDFVVKEDGIPQQVATFSDASDLPLTLGLAIDSSASMFVKLPRVQDAAIQFLNSTFTEQDRAFVVDFDSQPRLARGTTSELDRVVGSIRGLEASGQTALWESIVYSLVQLQGVSGRKALVVFSDGADEDDQFPFRSALTAAKRMGAPIYLILMRSKPTNKNSINIFTRSFATKAQRIVEATGGRVFYAKEYSNLDRVYDEIEHELRSQYLLAYYPRAPNSTTWRNVDVAVEGRGLKSRTLSGYWN